MVAHPRRQLWLHSPKPSLINTRQVCTEDLLWPFGHTLLQMPPRCSEYDGVALPDSLPDVDFWELRTYLIHGTNLSPQHREWHMQGFNPAWMDEGQSSRHLVLEEHWGKVPCSLLSGSLPKGQTTPGTRVIPRMLPWTCLLEPSLTPRFFALDKNISRCKCDYPPQHVQISKPALSWNIS